MKSTINPFKWLSYSLMIKSVEKKVNEKFSETNISNIELAASTAMELLTSEAQHKKISCDEFAYILYCLTEDTITYQAVYSLEMIYGKIPSREREKIADSVAQVHYKIQEGILVESHEYADIYQASYQRLDIPMPS